MEKVMRSKCFVLFWIYLLVAGYVLCSDTQKEATAQSIELKLATYGPPPPDSGDVAQGIPWFASELEKRTNGKARIKVFWSGSLAKQMEMPRAVKSGIADMATVTGVYHPEIFPYEFGSCHNAMIFAGKELGAWKEPYRKLLKEFPETVNMYENQNQKILATWEYDKVTISLRKPIKTLADFKGMKIRTAGEFLPRYFKAVGFTPVSIPATEAYDSLQRGMVDAVQGTADLALKYRWYEVCKYYLNLPIFGTSIMFFMPINLDTWKKLPPDVQKIMADLGDELTDRFPTYAEKTRGDFNRIFTKSGGTFITISEADQKEWKAKVAKDAMEYYVKRMEEKNIPKVRQIVYRFAELAGYEWK